MINFAIFYIISLLAAYFIGRHYFIHHTFTKPNLVSIIYVLVPFLNTALAIFLLIDILADILKKLPDIDARKFFMIKKEKNESEEQDNE